MRESFITMYCSMGIWSGLMPFLKHFSRSSNLNFVFNRVLIKYSVKNCTLFSQKIWSLGIDTISNAIFYENSIKSKAYNS